MWFCAVKGCTNKKSHTKGNVVYHIFPKKDLEQRAKWINFCGWYKGWLPKQNQGICSLHFNDSCYDDRYTRRQLKADAVPGERMFGMFDEATFRAMNSKRTGTRESAVAHKKQKTAEKCFVTTVVNTSDDDDEDDDLYDYIQNEDDVVEGKVCKICQSALVPEAKYLLQHAVKDKSYKDIIQETLNVPVFYDDDENMRICEKCSNFIEDLHSFVTLCRANLAQVVAKPRPQKQKEPELSEEEDVFDCDAVFVKEENSDSNEVDNEPTVEEISEQKELELSEEEDAYDCEAVSAQEEVSDSDEVDTEPMIQEISIIHESRDGKTVKANMLDPLGVDAGPSNTNDSELHQLIHFENHSEPNLVEIQMYACQLCDFNTGQQDHLLRHVRSLHTDKRPYGCTVCDSTFSNALNHCMHFQRHKMRGEAKQLIIKCAYCGIMITKSVVFERHLTNAHPSEAVTV